MNKKYKKVLFDLDNTLVDDDKSRRYAIEQILIEKDGHFGLVDACVNMEKLNNYFSKIGVKKLDFIILTHFHKDHYGSIGKIVNNYPVDQVIFKDFSGVVAYTSNGQPADDEYRADEIRICEELKETIAYYHSVIFKDFSFKNDLNILVTGARALKIWLIRYMCMDSLDIDLSELIKDDISSLNVTQQYLEIDNILFNKVINEKVTN